MTGAQDAAPSLAEIDAQDDETITLDGGDPRLYELGLFVDHSSSPGGGPDVGVSLGLGNGRMLYAGEAHGRNGDVLVLYGQHEHSDIAEGIDREAAYEMMGFLAGAISRAKVAGDEDLRAELSRLTGALAAETEAREKAETRLSDIAKESVALTISLNLAERERDRQRDVAAEWQARATAETERAASAEGRMRRRAEQSEAAQHRAEERHASERRNWQARDEVICEQRDAYEARATAAEAALAERESRDQFAESLRNDLLKEERDAIQTENRRLRWVLTEREKKEKALRQIFALADRACVEDGDECVVRHGYWRQLRAALAPDAEKGGSRDGV